MFRVFYIEDNKMNFIVSNLPIEILTKKYNIYLLTDMCGNVIIDNRKGNER